LQLFFPPLSCQSHRASWPVWRLR